MSENIDWAPTPHIRWAWQQYDDGWQRRQVLQQWWAPNVPDYMQGKEGEWRDVAPPPGVTR